jgi:DNA polymerase-4
VRGHDFTTVSRSETAAGPTDDPAVIRAVTRRLLPGAIEAATRDVSGVRLLGVGVSGLADWAQVDLFAEEWDEDEEEPDDEAEEPEPGSVVIPVVTVEGERAPRQFGPLPPGAAAASAAAAVQRRWLPGQDVAHEEHGAGWVQGSGLGRVTVRFETPGSEPGRIRTLSSDDPGLRAVDSGDVAREAIEALRRDAGSDVDSAA